MNKRKIVLNPPYYDREEQEIIESIDLDSNTDANPDRLNLLNRELQEAAKGMIQRDNNKAK